MSYCIDQCVCVLQWVLYTEASLPGWWSVYCTFKSSFCLVERYTKFIL